MMEKYLFLAARAKRRSFPRFLRSPRQTAFAFRSTSFQIQLVALVGLAIGLLSISSLPAQPAIVFLKNGDRVTGTVLSEDTNRITLSNLWSKEIIIPLSAISRREKIAPAIPALTVPPGVVQAPGTASAKGSNQLAKGVAIAPGARPAAAKHWAGDIQLGTDLGYSEKQHQNYTAHAKITYAKDKFRHVLEYDFAYGRTEGVTSTDRMDGSSKIDYDYTPRWYVYSLGSAGYDRIRKIDYRMEVGPGIGYHLIKITNFVFNTEAGIDYQSQHLKDDTRPDLFFYRLAENSTWQLNKKLTLDEKFEYMPRVEKLEEYKLRFESNLRYGLGSNLSLVLTVLDLFESRPAAGVSQNDLQVRSSLGVKF
jgi:putative salt-induced outer membrane protein YdiY